MFSPETTTHKRWNNFTSVINSIHKNEFNDFLKTNLPLRTKLKVNKIKFIPCNNGFNVISFNKKQDIIFQFVLSRFDNNPYCAIFSNFIIHENYRHKGIGTDVQHLLVKICQLLNVSAMICTVNIHNEEMKALLGNTNWLKINTDDFDIPIYPSQVINQNVSPAALWVKKINPWD